MDYLPIYPSGYDNRKRRTQAVAFGVFRIFSLFIVIVLFAILGFIIYKGAGVISWDFLTKAPSDGMTSGGIFPAIVGTLLLMLGSAIVAFPIGIMSGIYMNEYASKTGWAVKFIRLMTNNLSGVPSIVFGLFGMALFVKYLGFGDSILAGSLTLGLLSLPLVIRTTEEALKDIPDGMREGSLALGAGKVRTLFKVVLPSALPGIMSAIILSMGRVVSESAPFMYTMGSTIMPMPESFLSSGTTLAVALYKLAGEGRHTDEAYATAFVLLVIVLALNLLASFIEKKLNKKLQGDTNAVRSVKRKNIGRKKRES